MDYSQVLVSQGRFDEARVMAESGARMEPIGMDLSVTRLVRAIADLGQDRLEEARDKIFRAIYAHQQNVLVAPHAVVILYVLGGRDAATRLYQQFASEFPDFWFENPFNRLVQRPIDQVISSQRLAGAGLPPDALNLAERVSATLGSYSVREGPTISFKYRNLSH